MKKLLYMIICIVCLVSVLAISEKSMNTVVSDNLAYVDSDKGYMEQYPFMLEKGKTANINFKPSIEVTKYTVCFDFYGQDDKVVIKSFMKKNLFFDSNLNERSKDGKYVCMKQVSYDNEIDFSFEAEYSGDGLLKYDIYIPELNLTLDPYLVGNLSNSNRLIYHLPFDNNISELSLPTNFHTGVNPSNSTTVSTGSTSLTLVKTIFVNNFVTEINNSLRYTGSAGTQTARYTYYYNDSTTSQITITHSSAVFYTQNYTNPSQDKIVDKVELYLSADPLSSTHEAKDDIVYIYNKTFDVSFNGTINYSTNVVNENNKSILFNGTEEFIRSNLTVDGLLSTSISLWVKPNNLSATNELLGWYKNSNEQFFLRIRSDGYLDWFLGDGSSTCDTTNDGEVIVNGSWYHLAVVWNGTHTVRYINGVLSGSVDSCNINGIDIDGEQIFIGTRSNQGAPSTAYYEGSMDELMIYNYALSGDEIDVLSNGYNASINFTLYDAETLNIISGESVTIDFFNVDNGYTDSITTSTGIGWINGLPAGNTRLNFYSDNYDGNTIYEVLTTNSENFYNLYMTNSTDSNIKDVLLHVNDGSSVALEGAEIIIYALNTSTGNFYTVSNVFTNINGESLVELVKDSVWYKFTVKYNGAICYATTNSFLITNIDDNIYFRCNTESEYINVRDSYNSVNISISAINNSNTTGYFTLTGNSDNTTYYCLEVIAQSNGVQQLYNNTCVNSTTALITVNVNSSNYTNTVTFIGSGRYIPLGQSDFSKAYIRILTFINDSPVETGLTGIFIVMFLIVVGLIILVNIPIMGVLYIGFVTFITTLISELSRFKILPVGSLSSSSTIAFGSGVLAICLLIAFAISKRGSE